MKRSRIVILVVAIGVMAFLHYTGLWDLIKMRAYGVRVDWTFGGASSTVPTVTVKVPWNGGLYECPYIFSGVTNPKLQFYDVTGDGYPDFVFGSSEPKMIVGYVPSRVGAEPQFTLIKNETGG